MKLLHDENLPRQLRHKITGHDCAKKVTLFCPHGVSADVSCLSHGLVVYLCLFCFAQLALADITIDPNSTGATDVVQDPNGASVLLVNPLADPLDLGTDWLAVGNNAIGALAIENGGTVSNGHGTVGRYSAGYVRVDGVDSTWTNNGYLGIGSSANGTLNITNGGSVSNQYCYIGGGTTGKVTVDGAGSTLTNSDGLTVGDARNGTLTITGGGEAISTFGYVGRFGSSRSKATVDGVDSTWTNSGNLHVGYYGNGILNITNAGSVSSSRGYIGERSRGVGEVTVDGFDSTWMIRGKLSLGDAFGFSLSTGMLYITDGGKVSVGGSLAIHGNSLVDSSIRMATGGMLALNGDADDSFQDFLELINGSDAIRYWDDSLSVWTDITSATNGVDYTLSYQTTGDLAGYTVLTVNTTEPNPDLDDDGDVDGNDFLTWQQRASPTPLSSYDLYNWENNFGTIDSSVTAASAAIPEPSSYMLLLVAAACSLPRRETGGRPLTLATPRDFNFAAHGARKWRPNRGPKTRSGRRTTRA